MVRVLVTRTPAPVNPDSSPDTTLMRGQQERVNRHQDHPNAARFYADARYLPIAGRLALSQHKGQERGTYVELDTYATHGPRDRLRGASPMATESP